MEYWSGISLTVTTLAFLKGGFGGLPANLEFLPLAGLALAYIVLVGVAAGLFRPLEPE